jgi:phage tail-like protein
MARAADNDPLEKFRFQVVLTLPGGLTQRRAGFHDVQMPKRSTTKIMYREGDHPDINMISAGLNSMEDIVMSRGLLAKESIAGATADTSKDDFYLWMSKVHSPTAGVNSLGNQTAASPGPTGSNDYRATISITMLDRSGAAARKWELYNCVPTNFVPGADLNASEDGEKSIQSLTIAYEDFKEVQI